MGSSNETITESRLIVTLCEYKNPLCIFCLGILIGTTFYFQHIDLIILISLCLIILILFLFFKSKKIILLIVAIIFGHLYAASYLQFTEPHLNQFLNQRYIYIGKIRSGPNNNMFYKTYDLNLETIQTPDSKNKWFINNCSIQVTGSKYEEYEPEDTIQITGVLKYPKSAILPGLFDEKKFLLTKNIHYLLKADNGSLVFLDEPKSTKVTKIIYKLRNRLLSINKKFLDGENLSIINGIIFGSKASALSSKLKEKIQSLGLSHITSASGFNVSILAVGIFSLFGLFNYKKRLFPTLICICTVLLYSAIADFSPSIIRATVFIILLLTGSLFDKKMKALPGISIITIGFFLYNPISLLDTGLQLSILGFLGLDFFANEAIGKSKNWFLNTFYQSLFAQIMVIPLIVFYFHNIQLLGLVSNLAAVPLASLILITGILNLIFSGTPVINCIFQKVLFYSSELFLGWVSYLDKVQFKQIFLPGLNFYLLILTYLIVLLLLVFLFVRFSRTKAFVSLLVLIFVFFITCIITDTSKYLKIFFLPVYNQDAILIMPPNERPIYLSTRPQDFNKHNLKEFLMLSNSSFNTITYNLNNSPRVYFPSNYVKDEKNKIKVRYKNLSIDIIKNYNEQISPESEYIKLPILNKKDPPINTIFNTLPKRIIINDFKRLSKKSKKDILWLKSKPAKSYFLSETGTITLVSDGKKIYLTTAEN